MDMVGHEFGVEALGMRMEALHEFRPLDSGRVGRPVVDVGGGHQLPALGDAGDQHRLEIGPGGVDRGGVAGGAGAQDQEPGMFGGAHRVLESLRISI